MRRERSAKQHDLLRSFEDGAASTMLAHKQNSEVGIATTSYMHKVTEEYRGCAFSILHDTHMMIQVY